MPPVKARTVAASYSTAGRVRRVCVATGAGDYYSTFGGFVSIVTTVTQTFSCGTPGLSTFWTLARSRPVFGSTFRILIEQLSPFYGPLGNGAVELVRPILWRCSCSSCQHHGQERRQLVFIACPEASPCFCRYEHLEKEPVEGKERMSR